MTTKTPPQGNRDKRPLAEIISIYGVDPGKWPAEYAKRYETAGEDVQVGALLRQEEALDRLLDALPGAPVPDGAIDRLLARVGDEAKVTDDSVVVPFAPPTRRSGYADGSGVHSRLRPAAALLAASLLVGVYVGQSDLLSSTTGSFFTTIDSSSDVVEEAFYWLSLDESILTEGIL